MKRELGIARCGLACCLCTENALEWVQRMNNIRACAMEILNEEIIYA